MVELIDMIVVSCKLY